MSYTGPRGTNPDRDANRAGRTVREPGSGGSRSRGGDDDGFGLNDITGGLRDFDRFSRQLERTSRSSSRAAASVTGWGDQYEARRTGYRTDRARADLRYDRALNARERIQLQREARANGYSNVNDYLEAVREQQGGQMLRAGGAAVVGGTAGYVAGRNGYVDQWTPGGEQGRVDLRGAGQPDPLAAERAALEAERARLEAERARLGSDTPRDGERRRDETPRDEAPRDSERRRDDTPRDGETRRGNRGAGDDIEIPEEFPAASGPRARAYRLSRQPAPPRPNASTEQVTALQRMLIADGAELGTSANPRGDDGKYGRLTHGAVLERCEAWGIDPTKLNFMRPNAETTQFLERLRESIRDRRAGRDRDEQRGRDETTRDEPRQPTAEERAAAERAAAEQRAAEERALTERQGRERNTAETPALLRGSPFDHNNLPDDLRGRADLAARTLIEIGEFRDGRMMADGSVRMPNMDDMRGKINETIRRVNRRFNTNYQEVPEGGNIYTDDAMDALGLRLALDRRMDLTGSVNAQPQVQDPAMQAALQRAQLQGVTDTVRGGEHVRPDEERQGALVRNEQPVNRDRQTQV